MAASDNSELALELVVNRWLVDYYSSLALKFFRDDNHKDFCAITAVLDSVLARPFEATDDMSIKIRVLQFLSRINEGEHPDVQFEADNFVSPLESALILLEQMIEQFALTEECPIECQNVCTSLKEMTVGIFIMKNKFDEAQEVLHKYLPDDAGGNRAIFMDLICRKSQGHEVIEQMNFHQFKEEMLAFCLRVCKFGVPFLCKAANRLVSTRLMEKDDQAATDDKCDEPGPSTAPQIINVRLKPCKHLLIQRTKLAAVYKALATCEHGKTFSQLEQEVEAECWGREDLSPQHSADHNRGDDLNSEQVGLFQRDSCSPMEASPADQPPQTHAQEDSIAKAPYTIARLVVEPDSQTSSQCTTAPEQLETDVRTEKPPQTPVSNKKYLKVMESPVGEISIPIPKRPRKASRATRASTSMAECSTESEDDSCDSADRKKNGDALNNQSNRSFSKNRKKSSRTSESEENVQDPCQTPVQNHQKQLPRVSTSNDSGDADDVRITDDSSDNSPNHPVPQKSSTPHKVATHDEGPSRARFKSILRQATGTKDTWEDEELYFPPKRTSGSNESTLSNSSHRKKRWTESESQKLKEGVQKFGEGNWSKIQAYYSFKDRTNVNLKDRWRTMKKLKMV